MPLLILSLNADVNYKNTYGVTALIYAAMRGKYDNVNYLLVNGANPNAHDKPLPSSIREEIEQYPDIESLLIQHGFTYYHA